MPAGIVHAFVPSDVLGSCSTCSRSRRWTVGVVERAIRKRLAARRGTACGRYAIVVPIVISVLALVKRRQLDRSVLDVWSRIVL